MFSHCVPWRCPAVLCFLRAFSFLACAALHFATFAQDRDKNVHTLSDAAGDDRKCRSIVATITFRATDMPGVPFACTVRDIQLLQHRAVRTGNPDMTAVRPSYPAVTCSVLGCCTELRRIEKRAQFMLQLQHFVLFTRGMWTSLRCAPRTRQSLF